VNDRLRKAGPILTAVCALLWLRRNEQWQGETLAFHFFRDWTISSSDGVISPLSRLCRLAFLEPSPEFFPSAHHTKINHS